MLKNSKIELNERSLTISLISFGVGRVTLFELLGGVFAYWVVHQFANSELAEINPQIKLLYLLPILIVWGLLMRIKKNNFRQKTLF